MMNLERLRTLHAVATHGSLSAAAQALNVSASAVSQQLSRLEDEVGERLLERRGRGIGLTDAATLLAGHAARALSVLTEAEAELDARRSAVAGQLTVAAFATAARGLAPAALRDLDTAHPALQVILHEMEPHESVPRLARGDLDLAIAQDWVNAPLALPDGLARAPLLDDVADIALPRRHPLAGREWIALSELASDPWITWPLGAICHDWLMHTLRSLGRDPWVRHTAAEYPTQLALVAAGLGASVLPRLGRGPVPSGVKVVPVRPALHRHVYAIWRQDATRRTAIQAAVAAFVASADSLQARPTPRAPKLVAPRKPSSHPDRPRPVARAR
jgi:DNA-binding transcriptional LysR family regulator